VFSSIPPHIQVMGILNCTPDSFSDGGRSSKESIEFGLSLLDEGADWIDVGGESTRPGASQVDIQEEINRVVPVISSIKKSRPLSKISIDTRKAQVAKAALEAGAELVNDVSGLAFDKTMALLIAHQKCRVIIMHSRGEPHTMQAMAHYSDVVEEVKNELKEKIQKALECGIKKNSILIDPGFGFAKTVEQNVRLLSHLNIFHAMGFPLVVGLSRKSFLGKITDSENINDRLEASLTGAVVSVLQGAEIVRVHDVKETRRVIRMLEAISSWK
jgi:dihydropteroate synthase